MQAKTSSLIKGIGIGMISGAAVTVAVKCVTDSGQNLTKGSAKLIKAMGEIVDGVQTMFK